MVVASGVSAYRRGVRLFVSDGSADDWSELTPHERPVVRLSASDLQRAQRGTARLRAERTDVDVILDITVAVPGSFRALDGDAPGTLRYAGTVDGLTGLVADIERADVADGVTLIAASPHHDPAALGEAVLANLALREAS